MSILIREAAGADLPAIIGLYGGDDFNSADGWDEARRPAYEEAFARIAADPAHTLFVAIDGREVVGTFLLTVMPGLTLRGMSRAVLRSVEVLASRRSQGIGALMVARAEEEARARGCGLVELTSNAGRIAAHRFYERLGYEKSHAGFKKLLPPA